MCTFLYVAKEQVKLEIERRYMITTNKNSIQEELKEFSDYMAVFGTVIIWNPFNKHRGTEGKFQ